MKNISITENEKTAEIKVDETKLDYVTSYSVKSTADSVKLILEFDLPKEVIKITNAFQLM